MAVQYTNCAEEGRTHLFYPSFQDASVHGTAAIKWAKRAKNYHGRLPGSTTTKSGNRTHLYLVLIMAKVNKEQVMKLELNKALELTTLRHAHLVTNAVGCRNAYKCFGHVGTTRLKEHRHSAVVAMLSHSST